MGKEVMRALKGTPEVNGKRVYIARIIRSRTDKGGEFYVYNMYDEDGKIQTLNAYCYKDDDVKRPFDILTPEEEEILNPIAVIANE